MCLPFSGSLAEEPLGTHYTANVGEAFRKVGRNKRWKSFLKISVGKAFVRHQWALVSVVPKGLDSNVVIDYWGQGSLLYMLRICLLLYQYLRIGRALGRPGFCQRSPGRELQGTEACEYATDFFFISSFRDQYFQVSSLTFCIICDRLSVLFKIFNLALFISKQSLNKIL